MSEPLAITLFSGTDDKLNAVALEVTFLIESELRDRGLRDRSEIHYYCSSSMPFSSRIGVAMSETLSIVKARPIVGAAGAARSDKR